MQCKLTIYINILYCANSLYLYRNTTGIVLHVAGFASNASYCITHRGGSFSFWELFQVWLNTEDHAKNHLLLPFHYEQGQTIIYIYIPRTPMTSVFEGRSPQNKAFSNQNKGHLGSRYRVPPPRCDVQTGRFFVSTPWSGRGFFFDSAGLENKKQHLLSHMCHAL